MKTKTITPLGALHPVLFFAGVYAVALLFSVFICSSLFYSCHSTANKAIIKKNKPDKQQDSKSQNVFVMAVTP